MKITSAFVLAGALLAPASFAQNLLTNPGFESGLAGWSTFGNAFAEPANPPSVDPRTGSQLVKMFGNFSGGFDVSGIYQAFPAAPGDEFTIDAWSRHWSGDALAGGGAPADNWVVMKIAFFGGGGTEIGGSEGTILDGTSPTDTWIDNAEVTGIAPAGTVSVQCLILYLQPGNAGGAALIDDVSFTATSQPPSGNLLANADFESGLSGWSVFGNAFGESTNPPAIVPQSGSQACKMFGNFSGAFDVSGIYQSFPASPGQTFTIDAWSRHFAGDALIGGGPPNDNWVVMKMAFFDAGGTEIGGAERIILDGNSPTDTWIHNAPVNGTAPPGTATVQCLILYLQPGNAGGAALIDDVSFTTGTPTQTATIEITSAPAYGGPGVITGNVSGVDFATHRVAVYLYIDGAGWWTKPSDQNPTVAIQPDGTFTANVYTCCLDGGATLFTAAVLAPGVNPPIAAGSCRIPSSLPSLAEDTHERWGRTLEFGGRTWAVKESPSPVGPGGNVFSDHPADVFVDGQGQLHLRVVFRDGVWKSSEVVLVDDVGYGTYWFTTESQVGSLDPNLTFGAFTWDPFCDDTTIPAWPNREIDFEDSRWGNPGDPFSSQVVVQPYDVPGNLVRYTTPFLSPTPTLTRHFTWQPHRVDYMVAKGQHSPGTVTPADVVHESTYLHNPAAGRRVPPAGREKWRFNLWINGGGAPSNGQTAEVIISDFRFSDTVGVFPAGCGINPNGSAVVLSGGPFLGTTITLGVDNPTGTQNPGALANLLLGFAPTANYPCGIEIPGFGMTGPTGELLVDLSNHVALPGGPWTGPGNAVPIQITIPPTVGLVGASLYTQGVMLDITGAVPIGLAGAQELCIGL